MSCLIGICWGRDGKSKKDDDDSDCVVIATADITKLTAYYDTFLPSENAEGWQGLVKRTFNETFAFTISQLVSLLEDGRTYVITGDIAAEWLRDSSAQMAVYLAVYNSSLTGGELTFNLTWWQRIFRGLIEGQSMYILMNSYANSFLDWPTFNWSPENKLKGRGGFVHTDNYESDSLSYFLWISYHYWRASGDAGIFTENWRFAAEKIIIQWIEEQNHSLTNAYTYDELPNDGLGPACSYTGMTWSAYRPSDDACVYSYNIAQNMFAVQALDMMEEMLSKSYPGGDVNHFLPLIPPLRNQISEGIEKFGWQKSFNNTYAYEVDGFGHTLFMDDANVPSLLSAPYLGYLSNDDPRYLSTRNFVLSSQNPYYYSCAANAGIGSPHTPVDSIWPLGLTMQGLTSTDPKEQIQLLATLVNTTAGTFLMHESFNCNNPSVFTRSSFGWANSLFAQFVIGLIQNQVLPLN